MEKKVVVATNNAHKLEEIGRVLSQLGWECVSLGSCGDFPEPVEDADTFEGNARIKAVAARENTGMAALADDSGLEVDALGGAPGVYSSRYAGEHGNDAANNAKLLAELEGVADEDRTARFRCALCFIDEDGNELSVDGAVEGHIGYEPAGENGFGYDPLFIPDGDQFGGRTMAQIAPEDKDSISHRGNALRAFVEAMR